MLLADLPAACRQVLIGAPPGMTPEPSAAAAPMAYDAPPADIENPTDEQPVTGTLH